MTKSLLPTFILSFYLSCAFGQQLSIAQLQHQLEQTKDDTSRMLILAELNILITCRETSQDSAIYYYQEAKNLSKRLHINNIDVYKNLIKTSNSDSLRSLTMTYISGLYLTINSDSAMIYAQNALDLARQLKYPKGEANAFLALSFVDYSLGNYPRSVDMSLKGLQIAEKNKLKYAQAIALDHLGNTYQDIKEYAKSIIYYQQCMQLCKEVNNATIYATEQSNLGCSYLGLNQLDSALYYAQLADQNARKYNIDWYITWNLLYIGKIYRAKNDFPNAFKYQKLALESAFHLEDYKNASLINLEIANLFLHEHQLDSSLIYAKNGIIAAQRGNYYGNIVEVANFLTNFYASTDPKEALRYSSIVIAAKDSLFNLGKSNALESITDFDKKEREYEIETATTAYKNVVRQNTLLAGLGVFLLIAFLLYRNNRQKQKTNIVLESTLNNLKSTQSQLIQSEKMASLGELTAGIAHEIQNPLNFVNNFSEVNTELIDELEQEADNGNLDEVKALAKDIKANEQKILHHGQRADAIVKGMLQHSRSSSGVKEPTDINALADEYLRLAYHGLRAKDKSFNATLHTDYDKTIGKINVIPQDIGRVILNLITNAFYAVAEKKKLQPEGYEPTVSVATQKTGDKVDISVSDNGPGIPQKVLDKIFQPFFTTKPTGQGTGLGLSLSYDIVKAHGGEIRVESKEGEGATFVIRI